MNRLYLDRLHIQAFGKFFDKNVGPFSPGLNVVYGQNEAGKTTVSAFVGGVLFGWEGARGQKNTYKPAFAQRSGTLRFVDEEGRFHEVSRTRNADGPACSSDEARRIVESLDKETFKAMFSLNSDELRSLGDAANMTSKLLTAGSGTEASPAEALRKLDRAIATYTSRSASATHSLARIQVEEDECKRRLAQAREESDRFKKENEEHEALLRRKDVRLAELGNLNARIELLGACEVEIRQVEEAIRAAKESLGRYSGNLEQAAAEVRVLQQRGRMPAMDEKAQAEALRRLDALEKESARLERRIDSAQDAFDRARAYAEEYGEEEKGKHSRFDGVIGACCAVLCCAGVAMLAKGLMDPDVFLLCAGLVVGACAAAAGAFFFLQRKRTASSSSVKEGADKLVSARRVLEVCEQDELIFSLRVQEELDALGLAEAQGSVSRARAIIEEVRVQRLGLRDAMQRMRAIEARKSAEREMLDRQVHLRCDLFSRIGCPEDQGLEGVRQVLEETLEQRDLLLEAMRRDDIRIGELRQRLSDAERSQEFDLLKTQRAQIITKKNESAEDLAKLLLARRALVRAIDEWKNESVPEVYARASQLLSIMTGGAWTEVRMKDDGALVAVDVSHSEREPRFLSMGTCQQLYLALRIALLECVEGVGNAVPVLADDILVNFDDERRKGAVRALNELAKKRQVIFFTCHKEIVEAVRQYADGHTLVAL